MNRLHQHLLPPATLTESSILHFHIKFLMLFQHFLFICLLKQQSINPTFFFCKFDNICKLVMFFLHCSSTSSVPRSLFLSSNRASKRFTNLVQDRPVFSVKIIKFADTLFYSTNVIYTCCLVCVYTESCFALFTSILPVKHQFPNTVFL